MFQFKIFPVDAQSHSQHRTGNFLFRFFITLKIQPMAILCIRMTKTTGNTQAILEIIDHDSLELFGTDVFG